MLIFIYILLLFSIMSPLSKTHRIGDFHYPHLIPFFIKVLPFISVIFQREFSWTLIADLVLDRVIEPVLSQFPICRSRVRGERTVTT